MIYQDANSVGTDYFQCIRYNDFFFIPHLHRHPELVYVKSGEILLELDEKEYVIRKNEFALILSNHIHSFSTPKSSVSDVCIFSEQYVPSFFKDIRGKMPDCPTFFCSNSVTEFAKNELLLDNSIPERYMIKSALYAVLGEYLKSTSFSALKNKDETLLDKIVGYVNENFKNDISLKSMAEYLGYEEHYISRYFHSRIDMNFAKYVNWYRVDCAKDLLYNTNMSITEVAMHSGFKSIRSFNRTYLELTGSTPSGQHKRTPN